MSSYAMSKQVMLVSGAVFDASSTRCLVREFAHNADTHLETERLLFLPQEGLDWLKEASLLDSTANASGDISALSLGADDDDVPDWLKD